MRLGRTQTPERETDNPDSARIAQPYGYGKGTFLMFLIHVIKLSMVDYLVITLFKDNTSSCNL